MHHPTDRQDNTYHDICYTSRGALARTIKVNVISFLHKEYDRWCYPSRVFFFTNTDMFGCLLDKNHEFCWYILQTSNVCRRVFISYKDLNF